MNLMQDWQADAFWQWSLQTYANPLVKSACLHLQDKYACNVNQLLLCLYIGKHHCLLSVSDCIKLTQAISSNRQVLLNLRQQRRLAKGVNQQHYQALLHQELEMEKVQQAQLIDQLNQLSLVTTSASVGRDNLLNNLAALKLPKKVIEEEECLYLFKSDG